MTAPTEEQVQISRNQTAILVWLRSLGHGVIFAHDPAVPSVDLPPAHKSIGQPCPYCKNTMTKGGPRRITKEHKHPRSRGGLLSHDNRLIVCYRCNNDKSDDTLDEWYRRLRKQNDPRASIILPLLHMVL